MPIMETDLGTDTNIVNSCGRKPGHSSNRHLTSPVAGMVCAYPCQSGAMTVRIPLLALIIRPTIIGMLTRGSLQYFNSLRPSDI